MSTGKSDFSSITDIFHQSSDSSAELLEKVSRIQVLQKKLRSKLEAPLAEHLNIANFSDESLTLYTDSPAWASRLRFRIQSILELARLEPGLGELKSVRVKIVLIEPNVSRTKPGVKISKRTAELIEETAKSINDQDLQSALASISRRFL